MPEMTLDDAEREVARLDPKLERESETYRTALVLLASMLVGPNIDRLADFTNVDRGEIQQMSHRLRKNGVWRGSKVAVDWFDEESGGVAFWLDVAVAQGLMERAD